MRYAYALQQWGYNVHAYVRSIIINPLTHMCQEPFLRIKDF